MNIFESVIDQTLNYYSQHVFDDYKTTKPKLKGRVRQKIIDDVKKIDKKIGVVEFFIKGSILTKNYSKNADIDVFVRVNANLYTEDQLRILLRPVFDEIDDTYLEGCPYPFQYYITNKKYNMENTEAVYDVLEDEWIKKSPSKNIDIDEYMDDFKKYVEQFSDFSEELRRNMIDYDILLDISPDQIRGLQQKLDGELAEINKTIDDLSEVYQEVRDMRNEAFSEEMTPAEIKKYGIKTRLPGNVVFKLLERYYYLDLYKRIRKIIGDDGKISHSEYDELNKLLKTKLTNEKVSFKNVFGDVRGRGDLQHKPRHRQQQANAGMLGHGDRKSVNLMPDYQRSKGIKGDHAIDGVKKTSRVIRVKQGTPEAIRLAKKYRIDNPVGKKTVAGNQHDQGITIIFEESLDEKIKRAKRILESKTHFNIKNDIKLEKRSENFNRDIWIFKKNETIIGNITIGTELINDRQTPRIIDINIEEKFRGRGLGKNALKILVNYYGILSSDNSGFTNPTAAYMWKSIGGRPPTENDPPSGKAKFIITKSELNN